MFPGEGRSPGTARTPAPLLTSCVTLDEPLTLSVHQDSNGNDWPGAASLQALLGSSHCLLLYVSVSPLLYLTMTLVIGFRSHPDNPG